MPALHHEPGAYAQPCVDRQRLPVHIYPGSEPVDPLGKAYPARQILQRAAFQHPLGALMPAKPSATGNAMTRLDEIAADRKSGVVGQSVSVSVDLGGCRTINKKHKNQ